MARAHVYRPITATDGTLLYGALVTVREATLSVPIAQVLYASASGTDQLPNPFIADRGVIDFWLEVPQRCSILAQLDGHNDVQVYLDAAPPPEETARTDAPLRIVGAAVPGKVLLSGSTAEQAVWGDPPISSGVSPLVTVVSQAFDAGQDPTGWTLIQQPTTLRSYVTDVPADQGFTRSLQATHSGDSGKLSVVLPGFTLGDPGYIALWIKTSTAAGESVVVSCTKSDTTVLTLDSIPDSRDWGYYRYPLAAGTYLNAKIEFNGASVYAGSTGHNGWVTGVKIVFGGQVPAHTHGGTGSNSVALGASAVATGVGGVAVGVSTSASATNATAVGYSALAQGIGAVAVGPNARAQSNGSVAVGSTAQGNATAMNWVAVGLNAYVDAANSVAVGYNAKAYAADALALGPTAYVGASASSAVAVGSGTQAWAPNSVAIGKNAMVSAGHTGSVALGAEAQTTAAGQIMLGSSAAYQQVVVAGRLSAVGAVNIGTDSGSRLGFFGAEGTTKPTVTGATSSNVALQNLLTALAAQGLITNSTT